MAIKNGTALANTITPTNSGSSWVASSNTSPDIVYGLAGNDIINYSTSLVDNDLIGGDGNDTISGGAGNDLLQGDSGNDTLSGNAGSDTFLGGNGTDNLDGGNGDDNLDGGLGNDTLTGGLGSDFIYVGAGTDSIKDLGKGADILYVSAGATANVILSSAWTADNQTGNDGIANLSTAGYAVNVAQTIGSYGYNITSTGNSANILTGSNQADILTGSTKADTLIGNDGNDNLNGGAGADALIGGLGNDTYTVDNTLDIVTETSGEGNDLVNSSITYTLLNNVENLILSGNSAINGTGNNGDNIISGNSAINTLLGNDGIDTLYGLAGNDILNGGNSNDLLIGGDGNDRLTGGSGADSFRFETKANATSNKDTITDFVSGTDNLEFSNATMTALGANGQFTTNDQRFWSSTTGTAHDATDRLIYNTFTGVLSYDSDGTGSKAAVQVEILGLTSHPGLVATDIFVV